MSSLDALVDHAADLQRQVDRLWTELIALWLGLAALAILVSFQAWQLRKAGP